ncbi:MULTISPECIES: dephospho-CoA kinase [unclassified Agarivorans]|uniref:dephospho-CoA kinase n=1 Tax=unclassified Agarivorans TaxID=2636026 RepID=UPI003D7D11B2
MIIGLTGGIASGKSQASALFEALGVAVVDADVVARQLVEPGQPALNQIIKHFGPQLQLANGQLDRAALRKIIFSEPEQKTWLNHLLHPLIRQQMQQQLDAAEGPYKILVAPLLLENKLDKLVDRVLMIDTPVALQIARTMARDKVNQSQAEQIIGAQMDREAKLAAATDIIVNDGELSLLADKVKEFHRIYLNLAKSHDS